MKKSLNYILIFLLFSTLISCGKDDIPPTVDPIEKKDVSFLFQVAEVTNKSVYENRKSNETVQKEIDDAVAVIVTIQDASNNIIYNREKLTINTTDIVYVSSSISLDFGTYTITEFIVLDALDNAIFLSPKDGSLVASNVTNTVPFSITVGSSSTDEISMEVLSSFNLTVEDFGYGDLDFTTVGEFTFVIDQTNELSMLIMNVDTYTDQFEYIIDWGDDTEELYMPVSDLTHNYSGKGLYTVTVKGNIKAIKSVFILNKGLVDIDFSTLASLERVLLISSQLTSIDVSSNTLLEHLNLTSFDNKITNIDVSSNTLLKTLSLSHNQLTSIDVSANTYLEGLELSNNKLTNIDLSNNLQLESLNLSSNLELASLDISSHIKLKGLNLDFMKQLNLNNMDVSIYPELSHLSLISNGLTTIDLSKNSKLTGIWLWENELTAIDLSTNNELIQMSLANNQLTSLDLSSNNKLEILDIKDNAIDTINISNNPMLYAIYLSENKINDIANMEAIYSQLLTNVKANNIANGQLFTQNNNYVISQYLIDAANELINDFNWNVSY